MKTVDGRGAHDPIITREDVRAERGNGGMKVRRGFHSFQT